MSREIIVKDKLVHLCVLETEIFKINNEQDRAILCNKMCEIAKEDGIAIINSSNSNLCSSCKESSNNHSSNHDNRQNNDNHI